MEYFDDYSVYIDGTAVFIVLTSMFFAIHRGLVKEVLGFGSWIVAALAVIYAIPASREYTGDMFDSKITADITVGIVVAILVLVICTLITYKSTAKIRGSALNSLDRTLGGIFGIVRGVFIVTILFLIANLIFTKEIKEEADYSVLKPHLNKVSEGFEKYMDSFGEEENKLDELFEKLNAPEVKPENSPVNKIKEGYKDMERKSLDQLIMETGN